MEWWSCIRFRVDWSYIGFRVDCHEEFFFFYIFGLFLLCVSGYECSADDGVLKRFEHRLLEMVSSGWCTWVIWRFSVGYVKLVGEVLNLFDSICIDDPKRLASVVIGGHHIFVPWPTMVGSLFEFLLMA